MYTYVRRSEMEERQKAPVVERPEEEETGQKDSERRVEGKKIVVARSKTLRSKKVDWQ